MGVRAERARGRITIERTFDARIEEVWEMWTTKEGIESWWGPDGFRVEVRSLDLRPGGDLHYAMIATGPEQVEFVKNAGRPTTTEHRLTYTVVKPLRHLAYLHLADFVPGVEPYEVATSVDLEETAQGVKMTLSFDAMHDEEWTRLAAMGWESELDKLARRLAA